MKLPRVDGLATWQAITSWAQRASSAISDAWSVEHRTDGTHWFEASPVPFASGNFTGAVSMTWTVTAGDVITNRVGYLGNWMAWTVEVVTTNVGGVASNNLRITLPDNRVANGRQTGTFKFLDTGADGTGVWIIQNGNPFVQLFKNYNMTNWTVGAGTAVCGQFLIEVR